MAVVLSLRHRVGGSQESCTCEECRAIKRVCILAKEAIAMKAARRRKEEQ